MDEALTHEQFAPYVGRRFSFEGHRGTLTLATIQANPQFAAPGAPRTPFTLLFQGPLGEVLPEGHYRATVEDGPVMAFYIMPIHTPERDRQSYQAVFN